jgi:hypothetical protein
VPLLSMTDANRRSRSFRAPSGHRTNRGTPVPGEGPSVA